MKNNPGSNQANEPPTEPVFEVCIGETESPIGVMNALVDFLLLAHRTGVLQEQPKAVSSEAGSETEQSPKAG